MRPPKSYAPRLRCWFPSLLGGFWQVNICLTPQFSYLKHSVDLLAPHPLRMREAHRLAVHECLLPLIFIFASLVASDVGSSYGTKQRTSTYKPLITERLISSSENLNRKQVTSSLEAVAFPTLSPSHRRKIVIPASLQAASQLKLYQTVLQAQLARQIEGQGRNLNIRLELSTTNLQN